jgi:hypothetical protein
MLKGGESGPAVVPGDSAKSLLIAMVGGPHARMPKQGAKLTPEEIADLRQWITDGAAWPATVSLTESRAGPDWWSLQPLRQTPLPAVQDSGWVQNPIDTFILATLESRGLRPSLPADRRTLIRRVTFDLHGLPPTPEEVNDFVNDPAPDAYEKLIDRLLTSPRYGERWGRHWLDVVHYGDTHGYDKDKRRPNAWRYRDYVIRSMNDDKPYPRFIEEQLAGDVLSPNQPDGILATGFIAAGPWDFVGHVELREGTVDKEKTRLLDRDDMVSTTVGTFLSLTAHCARCHDHKFDPIPQKDYYRLQAVFAGVDRGDRPFANPELLAKREGLVRRQNELNAEQTILLKIAAEADSLLDSATKAGLSRTADQLAEVSRQLQALPPPDLVYGVTPHAPRPIYLLHRGDVEQPRDRVQAGALSCVQGVNADFQLNNPDDEGSRRAALACWIADTKNPLTWRSIANRIWHYHFGRGLVDTPNDFGWNGARPTHPALLDWLAVAFRDRGGSFKAMHRLILLSSTYRQASTYNPDAAKQDADNHYLWRMNRQRLDAESLRDSILAVSGQLDLQMGGPGFELFRFHDDHSPIYDHTAAEKINDPATFRRTVYRFTVRSVPNPFLDCLDCADPNLNVPVRNTTLTALQALALLNDPFVVKQSEFFADRLGSASGSLSTRIEAAFKSALGRLPSEEERELLTAYAQKHGLANACKMLWNANEFLFVD